MEEKVVKVSKEMKSLELAGRFIIMAFARIGVTCNLEFKSKENLSFIDARKDVCNVYQNGSYIACFFMHNGALHCCYDPQGRRDGIWSSTPSKAVKRFVEHHINRILIDTLQEQTKQFNKDMKEGGCK